MLRVVAAGWLACATALRVSTPIKFDPAAVVTTYLLDAAVGPGGSQYDSVTLDVTVSTDRGDGPSPLPRPAARLLLASEAGWATLRQPGCNCTCQQAAALTAWTLPASPGGEATQTSATWVNPGGRAAEFVYALFQACPGEGGTQVVDGSLQLRATFSGWGAGEVPYNAVGLLPAYATATAVAGGAILVWVLQHGWLWAAQWAATAGPVKLAFFSLVTWAANACFLCVHWAVLAGNGVGEVGVEAVGRIADVVSRVILIALTLALVRGWGARAFLYSRKSPAGQHPHAATPVTFCTKLQVAFSSLTLSALYIAMGGWYLRDRDATSTTYVYDSPPGVLICCLHLLIAAWFSVEVALAWRRVPPSPYRTFLAQLGVCMVAYYALLPVAVGIGLALPDTGDEKAVEVMMQGTSLAAYAWLLWLFRPALADALFAPPAVATTFAWMEGEGEGEGAGGPRGSGGRDGMGWDSDGSTRAAAGAAFQGAGAGVDEGADERTPLRSAEYGAAAASRGLWGSAGSAAVHPMPADGPLEHDGRRTTGSFGAGDAEPLVALHIHRTRGSSSGEASRRDAAGSGDRHVLLVAQRDSDADRLDAGVTSPSTATTDDADDSAEDASLPRASNAAAAQPFGSLPHYGAPDSVPVGELEGGAASLPSGGARVGVPRMSHFAASLESPSALASSPLGGIAGGGRTPAIRGGLRTLSRSGSLTASVLAASGAASPLATALPIDAVLASAAGRGGGGGGGGGGGRLQRAATAAGDMGVSDLTATPGASTPATALARTGSGAASPGGTGAALATADRPRPKTHSSLHRGPGR